MYTSTPSAEQLAAKTKTERIHSNMIISVEARFPGGGMWKKIIAMSCNNLIPQQGSWMVKTTVRNLNTL